MTELDQQIEKQIKKLQNPKSNIRYEACEELRVAPSITPEAIQTLQKALEDPDASVAEAAQRALAVHLAPEPATDLSPKEEVQEKPKPRGVKYWPLIGIFASVIVWLIWFFFPPGNWHKRLVDGYLVLGSPVVILLGMLGAYLGRKRVITVWVLAILIASIAVLLAIFGGFILLGGF